MKYRVTWKDGVSKEDSEGSGVTPETVEVGETPKAAYLGVILVNGRKTIVVQSSTDKRIHWRVPAVTLKPE